MTKPGRPGSGAPTLRDIAQATGCSLMTVSRVLGEHAHLVAEPRRSRIRQVAEALGYRPNLNIRALRRGSGSLVGLLTERFDARSHGILIGLHDALVPHGLLPCLVVIEHGDGASGDAAVRQLVERRMAAIVAIPSDPRHPPEWLPALASEAMDRGIPSVLIGARPWDHQVPQVRCDLEAAARHLVDHAERQHGRRSCLMGDPRGDGWQEALADLTTAEARHRRLELHASREVAAGPEEVVLALDEGVIASRWDPRRPPSAWVSAGDPAAAGLPGTAVDLAWETIGRRAGERVLALRDGRRAKRIEDVPPLLRRQG